MREIENTGVGYNPNYRVDYEYHSVAIEAYVYFIVTNCIHNFV